MRLDEGGNVGLQFGGGSVGTPLQLLACQLGEPALHLIDPAGRGGGEMHVPVRAARQPRFYARRFVRGIVVHHQMHLRPVRHGSVDLFEEVEELGRPMSFARPRAGCDLSDSGFP